MPKCSVRGCDSSYGKNKLLSFHKFPQNEDRKQKWFKSIGEENLNLKSKSNVICSLHFEDSCFNRTLDQIRLRDDAIPCIFPNKPSSTWMDSKILRYRLTSDNSQHSAKKGTDDNVPSVEQMRCCVPMCKNDSRHISKSDGITFHGFPTELSRRLPWLQALGKEERELTVRSAVCSEHFFSEDLYETRSGMRKLKVGAVPIVIQETIDCDDEEAAPLKVCRICLSTESKLLPISLYKLQQAYQHLTGITLKEEDKLPQQLCVECTHRLYKFTTFRTKSLRASSLMMELLEKQGNLTLQNIKNVNRENNKLTSPLSVKLFEPDYYDNTYVYQEELPDIPKDEKPPASPNTDMKITDIEVLLSEQEEEDEKPQELDNDNDIEKDFVLSDHNYTTEDSLPEEKCDTNKYKIELKEPMIILENSQMPARRRRRPFVIKDLNITMFTIKNLTVEEQIADILKRKESDNYLNAIYKCEICYKGYIDEHAYNNHIARHTNKSGEYECEICKLHFKENHRLRKHMSGYHAQRFSCNECSYVTVDRQMARMHERWHKGTMYICPQCGQQFSKFTTYMGHLRKKHPSDFVCEICGFTFVSVKGIELHKKLKHRFDPIEVTDEGPYCELCNVRFVSDDAHRRHLNLSAKHNGDGRKWDTERKIYTTMLLSQTSKDGRKWETERKIYKRTLPSQTKKAEGPISCEQCGIEVADSRAYHAHFRRMHPDKNRTQYPSMRSPCMCELCGKMFQSEAGLKEHRLAHTGEKPFKCTTCGKSFRVKHSLVVHHQLHSVPPAMRRKYSCELCGKSFTHDNNRKRHMFIHNEGSKPCKCELCGKRFNNPSEKRTHITYTHLKKPWPKRTRSRRKTELKPDENLQQVEVMDVGTPESL